MIEINVPLEAVRMATSLSTSGDSVEFVAEMNIPELRWTDEQILANARALVNGEPMPFPNRNLFRVVLPRFVPTEVVTNG